MSEAANAANDADEQWVNELVLQISSAMNDGREKDVVTTARSALPRMRALHPDDGVLAFVLHQLGHALCVIGQKKSRVDEEGFKLLEEATAIFLSMEMQQQVRRKKKGECFVSLAFFSKRPVRASE